jgi:hypothetical protein
MHLMLTGIEPWQDRKSKSILDILYFSKNKIPFIKKGFFPISNKINNLDIRIFLKNTLEMNQLKRYNFRSVCDFISGYIHDFIIKDFNFDFMHNEIKCKGLMRLNILRKLYQTVINHLSILNNQLRKTNSLQ